MIGYHNHEHSGMMDEVDFLNDHKHLFTHPILLTKYIQHRLGKHEEFFDMYITGFVYYLLRKHVKLPKHLLKQAQESLNNMLHDPKHLQEFKDPTKRKQALKAELRLIQKQDRINRHD